MSAFTMPLKEVIELTGGTTEIVDGITKLTGGRLGMDNYPILSEEYRPILNGKIIDHYWNREIGLETIDMFQLAMRRKLNEIMPPYNLLYASTQLQYDPLSTINMETFSTSDSQQNVTSTGVNNAVTDTDSTSRTVSQEFPQNELSGQEDYASAAANATSKTTGTSDMTENQTSATDANVAGNTKITGYQGLASDLIMRYRESIINIDMMIIRDLNELFMLVWDTPDEYHDRRSIY